VVLFQTLTLHFSFTGGKSLRYAFVHYCIAKQNVAPAENHRQFKRSLIGFSHERIKIPWWFSNSQCKWLEVSKHKQRGFGWLNTPVCLLVFFVTKFVYHSLKCSCTNKQFFFINFWHEVLRSQISKLIIKRITFKFVAEMKHFLTLWDHFYFDISFKKVVSGVNTREI
jgi:hypothetical protein